jgi:hypothetical protein
MPLPLKNLPTPRRSLQGQRGVVFSVGAISLLGLASGCSLTPPAPLYPVATSSPASQQRAKELARYRSVNEAFAKLDAKTVRSWIERWTATLEGSQTRGPRAVRIDADVLARRHPAWILADELQKGAISPAAPQIARVMAVASPGVSIASAPGVSLPVSTLPARTLSENFDGEAARLRQNIALDKFFASAQARDALRGRDQAFLDARALEDAIASAQRGAVAELDLSLVPPDIALKMTNLRLQLLRSLSRTSAQRAASRAELQALQAEFVELWRQQTELQAARMREATINLPARLRSEGLERIAQSSQTEARKRFELRRVVAAEAKSRLRGDFIEGSPDLRLTLPATRRVGSVAARSVSGGGTSASQLIETTPGKLPSVGIRNEGALLSRGGGDAKIVATLRSKARLEARQWASLVAAQLGSQWNNSASNPDRTAAALSILFPSRGS